MIWALRSLLFGWSWSKITLYFLILMFMITLFFLILKFMITFIWVIIIILIILEIICKISSWRSGFFDDLILFFNITNFGDLAHLCSFYPYGLWHLYSFRKFFRIMLGDLVKFYFVDWKEISMKDIFKLMIAILKI